MKTLNLVNIEASDISYQVSQFPDGQQQVKIIVQDGYDYDVKVSIPVKIKARLNNFKDLELITCAVKSLRGLNFTNIHLYVPYFLGSRSDRKFEEGGNNYLKDVICPIINSLNFESITVLDPHSDVLEACINRFKKESNYRLVAHFAIGEIIREMNLPARLEDDYHNTPEGLFFDKRGFDNLLLASPDAGASKKIYKIAEQIGYKGDIITCSKDRDTEGKITKSIVPITSEQHNMLHSYGPYKDFIIIDDICDGGATFINIAKEIKAYFHESGRTKSKIYLIVTHGIFSKGLRELNMYFDGIYCTNSYSDMNDPAFSLANDNQMHKLKQLNVF